MCQILKAQFSDWSVHLTQQFPALLLNAYHLSAEPHQSACMPMPKRDVELNAHAQVLDTDAVTDPENAQRQAVPSNINLPFANPACCPITTRGV